MKLGHKILLALYYIPWLATICLAHFYLTEKYYLAGLYGGLFMGSATLIITLLTISTLSILYFIKKEKRTLNGKLIKLVLIPFLGLIPFIIILILPKQKENNIHKLTLSKIAYGCECADWQIQNDNGKTCKGENCEDIFLEPFNKSAELPDSIGYNNDIIEVSGYFYKNKGFPKGYYPQQQEDKARVFQYSTYKIIVSNKKESDKYP